MVRKIVNFRVLIDADDEFSLDDLCICVREERSRALIDPDLLPEHEVYLPATNYCEIVDYIHVYEEEPEGYD